MTKGGEEVMFAQKLFRYGFNALKGSCQEEDLTFPPLIFVFLVICFPLRFVYELWGDPSDLRIVAMGLIIIGYAMITSLVCGVWLRFFRWAQLPEERSDRILGLIGRIQGLIIFPLGVVVFCFGVIYR
jgi:hypothetical protein